jgi:hypothetical protein
MSISMGFCQSESPCTDIGDGFGFGFGFSPMGL